MASSDRYKAKLLCVVVPGIKGSSLYCDKCERDAWPPPFLDDTVSLLSRAWRARAAKPDLLMDDDDARCLREHGPLTATGVLHEVRALNGLFRYNVYGNLLKSLRASFAKDGTDCDVMEFAYDWTRGNRETAASLYDALWRRVRSGGAERVALVGHSMGGLVCRYALERVLREDTNPRRRIEMRKRIVLFMGVGVPHYGCVKSLHRLVDPDVGGVLAETCRSLTSLYDMIPFSDLQSQIDGLAFKRKKGKTTKKKKKNKNGATEVDAARPPAPYLRRCRSDVFLKRTSDGVSLDPAFWNLTEETAGGSRDDAAAMEVVARKMASRGDLVDAMLARFPVLGDRKSLVASGLEFHMSLNSDHRPENCTYVLVNATGVASPSGIDRSGRLLKRCEQGDGVVCSVVTADGGGGALGRKDISRGGDRDGGGVAEDDYSVHTSMLDSIDLYTTLSSLLSENWRDWRARDALLRDTIGGGGTVVSKYRVSSGGAAGTRPFSAAVYNLSGGHCIVTLDDSESDGGAGGGSVFGGNLVLTVERVDGRASDTVNRLKRMLGAACRPNTFSVELATKGYRTVWSNPVLVLSGAYVPISLRCYAAADGAADLEQQNYYSDNEEDSEERSARDPGDTEYEDVDLSSSLRFRAVEEAVLRPLLNLDSGSPSFYNGGSAEEAIEECETAWNGGQYQSRYRAKAANYFNEIVMPYVAPAAAGRTLDGVLDEANRRRSDNRYRLGVYVDLSSFMYSSLLSAIGSQGPAAAAARRAGGRGDGRFCTRLADGTGTDDDASTRVRCVLSDELIEAAAAKCARRLLEKIDALLYVPYRVHLNWDSSTTTAKQYEQNVRRARSSFVLSRDSRIKCFYKISRLVVSAAAAAYRNRLGDLLSDGNYDEARLTEAVNYQFAVRRRAATGEGEWKCVYCVVDDVSENKIDVSCLYGNDWDIGLAVMLYNRSGGDRVYRMYYACRAAACIGRDVDSRGAGEVYTCRPRRTGAAASSSPHDNRTALAFLTLCAFGNDYVLRLINDSDTNLQCLRVAFECPSGKRLFGVGDYAEADEPGGGVVANALSALSTRVFGDRGEGGGDLKKEEVVIAVSASIWYVLLSVYGNSNSSTTLGESLSSILAERECSAHEDRLGALHRHRDRFLQRVPYDMDKALSDRKEALRYNRRRGLEEDVPDSSSSSSSPEQDPFYVTCKDSTTAQKTICMRTFQSCLDAFARSALWYMSYAMFYKEMDPVSKQVFNEGRADNSSHAMRIGMPMANPYAYDDVRVSSDKFEIDSLVDVRTMLQRRLTPSSLYDMLVSAVTNALD